MLIIKNRDGGVCDFLADYDVIGPFAVHPDRADEKHWNVTHVKTGMSARGNAFPPFRKKKTAVRYAEIMTSYPIDWDFQTETEMKEKNDKTMLEHFHRVANEQARS